MQVQPLSLLIPVVIGSDSSVIARCCATRGAGGSSGPDGRRQSECSADSLQWHAHVHVHVNRDVGLTNKERGSLISTDIFLARFVRCASPDRAESRPVESVAGSAAHHVLDVHMQQTNSMHGRNSGPSEWQRPVMLAGLQTSRSAQQTAELLASAGVAGRPLRKGCCTWLATSPRQTDAALKGAGGRAGMMATDRLSDAPAWERRVHRSWSNDRATPEAARWTWGVQNVTPLESGLMRRAVLETSSGCRSADSLCRTDPRPLQGAHI